MTDDQSAAQVGALDLDALEALEKAATPAPWWHTLPDDTTITSRTADVATTCLYSMGYDKDYERMEADANLIEALRNAAPAIIARARECEALRAERDALRMTLDLWSRTLNGDQIANIQHNLTVAMNENLALRASNEALRTALEGAEKYVPIYEDWMDGHDATTSLSIYRCGPTFGHLCETRAAIRNAMT